MTHSNFYNADVWQHADTLKQCHAQLVQEFDQIDPNLWVPNSEHKIDQQGTWHFVPFLTRGHRVESYIKRCPTIQHLLNTLPIYDNCTFSIMGPGAKIEPHQGHSDRHLRVHLGIHTTGKAWIQVGDQTQHWHNGQVLIFQDSETHCVQNPSDQPRVILLFDILRSDYFDQLNT
jgi:aspartyl/asparaginyl beta-hydroxylase (cupin superfamily)